MAVLAGFWIGWSGASYVTAYGVSADSSVHFTPNDGGINVTVDFGSATLVADIEAAVKAKLQAAPYNMTFGVGDTVKLVTSG